MKRWMKRAAAMCLAVTMILGCCITASAAQEEPNRVYVENVKDGYTLTLLDAAGNPLTANPEEADGATRDVYMGVAKLKLTFTGDANEQYVVFLLNGNSTVPTQSNIRYINQQAGSATVEFVLYPDDLTQTGRYTVQLADSEEYAQVASLVVAEPLYTLGDVDEDGKITSTDASLILQHVVGIAALDSSGLSAADTDKDGKITSADASRILQYVVGLITEI